MAASVGLVSPRGASAATPSTLYAYGAIDSADTSGPLWGYRLASASLPGALGGAPATDGDFDGDGVNDFFVGHPYAEEVDLMSGKTFAKIRTYTSPVPQAGAHFGFGLAVLGDVSGDGKPDIAVGTDAQDVGVNVDQGKAWVLNGVTGAMLYALDQPAGSVQAYGRFGARLGRAGDITGDGRAEVIVGASDNDAPAGCNNPGAPSGPCRANQGQAFIFNGSTGALLRTLNLPDLDQPVGDCLANCGSFGLSVQSPGDVNGDGKPDQLVSAPSYKNGQGRMYLFSGADGSLLARINDPVPQDNALFGFQDAAPLSPGDVNGDGFPDLYANGFQQDGPTGLASQGRAWVFNGKATADAGTGQLLGEVVTPEPKFGGQFGWSMTTTDYNKDGKPDLYVGSAPHHEPNTNDTSGGSYVFKGLDRTLLKTLTLSAPDKQLGTTGNGSTSGLGSELGWALAAPGDLNGDSEPDYLAGAPFQDVGGQANVGQVFAFRSRSTRARPPADFDGNGSTDVSVYRNGAWYVRGGTTASWGLSSDIPVPGDYDGNGTTDIAVYRPAAGAWYVQGGASASWGISSDIPVPGDYDGNGTTDMAVYRNGAWYVRGGVSVSWGISGDVPVPGDYDGNGTTDIAVYRPSAGAWYVRGGASASWGISSDIPVPGDYDGNGSTDMAVYRNGTWYVRGGISATWGISSDIPVPGDYDRDGDDDIAVYRNGTWYVLGGLSASWGLSTDIPLPLPPAIRLTYF